MARTGVLTATLLAAAVVLTRAGKHWTYYGEAGPDHWPRLGFPQCAGERQSPINVVTNRVVVTHLPPITFRHFDQVPLTLTLTNNYHSATADMTWERTPMIEDGGLQGQFEVVNFHFHWGENDFKGSEHTIDGESFPLEMHIVCKNTKYANLSSAVTHQDGLAVLGIMFETADWGGPVIKALEPALRNITAGGATSPVAYPPRLLQLLPWNTRDFFRYRGSLTTPGCHEAVTWTVLTQTLQVTGRQLELFRSLRGGPAPIGSNYRPPQQRHGRTVLLSTPSELKQHQQQQQQQEKLAAVSSSRSTATLPLPQPLLLLLTLPSLLLMMTSPLLKMATGARRDV